MKKEMASACGCFVVYVGDRTMESLETLLLQLIAKSETKTRATQAQCSVWKSKMDICCDFKIGKLEKMQLFSF